MLMMEQKLVKFGNREWLLPFMADGYCVRDSYMKTVCECETKSTAEIVAELLNKKYASD